MKSKVFVISTLVLVLLIAFASQALAAGATSNLQAVATLTRTRTRTATKAPTRTLTRTVTLTRTPTAAASVTGSVLIHSGGCCMGGPVGTTINIDTAFSASSTGGAVTEMRIGHLACSSSPDLSSVAWEPYTTSKVFPHTIIAINWTSYYVDVQYRDAAGNVSPVYCDDIAIEGMPGLTPTAQTGTPTVISTPKTPTPTLTSMPGADFVGTPLSGNAPLTVQFTALNSSVLSTCTWNFGDGVTQTFTGQFSLCPSTTHTYTTAGSYTVSLSVMKVTGATNSMTKPNYVQVTGSSATLTPTPTLTRTPTPSPTKTLIITGT